MKLGKANTELLIILLLVKKKVINCVLCFSQVFGTASVNHVVCEFQGSENWGLKSTIEATNFGGTCVQPCVPENGLNGIWNTDISNDGRKIITFIEKLPGAHSLHR